MQEDRRRPRAVSDADALTGLMRTIVDGVITIDARGLIVDFNPACETLFEYKAVDLVETGMQALDAVRARPYDVVLMDISMPEMDGIQATRKIRQLEGPQSQVPIIALTANATKGDREKYLGAGMTDYLSKPIHIRSLIAALERQRGQPGAAG